MDAQHPRPIPAQPMYLDATQAQLDRIESMLNELTKHMTDTTEYRILHPDEYPMCGEKG